MAKKIKMRVEAILSTLVTCNGRQLVEGLVKGVGLMSHNISFTTFEF